ncbi:peptidyl-tRNA hydrolase domain protein [Geopyxis carbonaria]|nr:peptidyl-tRNA hydrolase domain protein [Geopyxis carbonaria]
MSIILRQLRLPCSASLTVRSSIITPKFYSSWREETFSKWKDDEEIAKAREWVNSFKESDIPRKNCVLTFAASSGPGGQNVNKLSTKATLHLDLASKGDFLPPYILRKVRENSRHLTKKDEIVVQCDESRKQSDNTEHAFHRLYTILKACVEHDLPGETSPEKHKHVKDLQNAERMQRMKIKNMQKSKKDSRRNKGGDL